MEKPVIDFSVNACTVWTSRVVWKKEMNGKKNPLRDYVFTSHLKKDHELVVFGNGSLFNHSNNPNVYYYHDQTKNRLLYYAASKDIEKGEELFISYGDKHSVNHGVDKNLVGSTH